jgi:branched-chain amino acid transport system substrate-binding protein
MQKKLSLLLVVVLVVSALGMSAVQAQDPVVIKIASQSPLSGGQSILGSGIRNGAELAIEQLSGPLAELGYQIQFVPYDDQATPDVGVANAQQIVADPEILAVIGHYNSGVAIPSSEVYNDNDLVMVSPANTGTNVTDRGLPTVNRVCGRDDAQGAVGAEYAASIGVTSVYILHDTTAYGQGVAEYFRTTSEDLGITVLGFEGTEERSNFEGLIQPIIALAPDAVYLGGIYDQFGVFVNQLVTAGYVGQILGPDGLDSRDFAELAGEAGVGTLYTSAAGPASVFPAAEQFIADYTEAYGSAPTPYAAEAYDSTAIVLAALERLISEKGALPTRAELAAEVRATRDFEGLTGTISFDANGDRELANYFVLEVGSSDPEEWVNNEVISQIQIPSPLTAASEEEASS